MDFSWGVLRDDVPDTTWAEMHALMGDCGVVNVTLQVCFVALICHCMDAFSMELPVGVFPLLPIER